MSSPKKSVRFACAPLSAFFAHRAKKSFRSASLRSKLFSIKSRKGQWFLVSAIIVIIMISTVILGSTQVKIGTNSDPWQKYSFENLKTESAYAINAMMLEDAASKNIEEGSKDYLDFLRGFGDAHGMNISAYFIVGLPVSSGMNVSVINFANAELRNVRITLNGTTKTISLLSDKSAETVAFTSAPDRFDINYTLIEANATGGQKTESGSFQTTRKMFSAVKLRVESKDESQIREKIEWK